jgi:hypothetical protein
MKLMAPVLHRAAHGTALKRAASLMPDLRRPSARAQRHSWVWAEARAGSACRAAVLDMGEGYRFAAQAMVRAAERIDGLPAGAFTPGSAYGPDFVLALDGVVRRDIDLTGRA